MLDENTRGYLHNQALCNSLLGDKQQNHKEKINWTILKLRTNVYQKTPIKRVKHQPSEKEEIFAMYTHHKILVFSMINTFKIKIITEMDI